MQRLVWSAGYWSPLISMFRTCRDLVSRGKEVLRLQMELKLLNVWFEWEESLVLSGWVQYNHKEGRKATGKKDTTTEAEAGVMCFEDSTEATGHTTQVASSSWKRQGNRCSPRSSCQLCGQLDFSPGRLILDLWPPKLQENALVLF